MEKNDKVFQMIILPSKTTKKDFLAYLDFVKENEKEIDFLYDGEHHMLDIYYHDQHYVLRTEGKSCIPYMNFILNQKI